MTQTKPSQGPLPITLDVGKVDGQWFLDWWTKDVKTKIDSRKPTFNGYKNNRIKKSQDKTLDDVVFEALGSIRNVKDFVLCESGINSFKAKLWKNSDPFDRERWMKIAELAASGEIPSNEHLSGVRTVLAVFDYMENAEVKSRMQQSIQNVKIELGNVKQLTDNNLPKTTTGVEVDLSAAWMDFMDKQLKRFHTKGQAWLKEMIKYGLGEYQKAVKDLDEQQKLMVKGESAVEADKRMVIRNKAVQEVTAQEIEEKKARAELDKANQSMETENKRIKGIKDSAKRKAEKKTKKYQALEKDIKDAKAKLETAKRAKNRAKRSVARNDKSLIVTEIADLKKDIGYLEVFEKASLIIKVPKAE